MGTQIRDLQNGVHCAVATPGRLNQLLEMRKMHLTQCVYLCLDEADRMVDGGGGKGFEEELRATLEHLDGQKYRGPCFRQTVLVSATMPAKILEFSMSMLRRPVVVSVGRTGSANKDITQE